MAGTIQRFDTFELDVTNRRLTNDGEPVELGNRYFDALALLVRNAGELVSKDRFMDEVWRGIPVTDEALTQCIRSLRRALGDDAGNPRYIQTVPKHGYRFLVRPAVVGRTDGLGPAPASSLRLPGRLAAAAAISGAAAGALGGLFYGLFASTGGASTVAVLTAMVAALGMLAGAGIGLGIAFAIAWRGRVDASIVAGAAFGGLAVGALGSLLGRDGVGLLTGADILHVAGPAEGLILGTCAGAVAWLLFTLHTYPRRLFVVIAAGSGAVAGLLIHALGGRLLGSSLYALQRGLGDTRLALERIAMGAGEADFVGTADLVATCVESAVFLTVLTAGLIAVGRD